MQLDVVVTFASSLRSVENYSIFRRHGCSSYFGQALATFLCDTPSSAASSLLDQCVTAAVPARQQDHPVAGDPRPP